MDRSRIIARRNIRNQTRPRLGEWKSVPPMGDNIPHNMTHPEGMTPPRACCTINGKNNIANNCIDSKDW